MSLDWFPWYPTDFRRDTHHLSLAEDGAYRRLIDEYMITRKPLPNDDEALARIIGIPKAEWDRLALRVRRFFRMRNDKLWHKRCELEIRAQNARHNRYSERSKKGALTKWSKANGISPSALLNGATLQYKESSSSLLSPSPARARPEPPAPAEPEEELPMKRPADASRQEIEASFPARRDARAAKPHENGKERP